MVDVHAFELVKNENQQVSVLFSCPKCGKPGINIPLNTAEGYNIQADGRISKVVSCRAVGCVFLDMVRLVGFNPDFFRGKPLTGTGTAVG